MVVLACLGVGAGAWASASRPERPDVVGLRGGRFVFVSGARGRRTLGAVPSVPQRAAWSPDGLRIAYVCGNFALCTADAAGGRARRVLTTRWPRRWEYVMQPAWSPDGASIAFASNRSGRYRIFVVGVGGRGLRSLAAVAGKAENPTWSPDARHIAFDARRGASTYIYVARADGRGVRRIGPVTGRASSPAWSPDGGSIAFTLRTAAGAHIAVMRADGSRVHAVTGGAWRDDHAAWSPDGASIAFDGNRGEHLGVWTKSLLRGAPQLVSGSRSEPALLPAFRPSVRAARRPVPAGVPAPTRPTGDARLVAAYVRWSLVVGNDFAAVQHHGSEAADAVGRHASAALRELGALGAVTDRGRRFRSQAIAAFQAAKDTAHAFALGFADFGEGKRDSGTAHIKDGFRLGQLFAANAAAASRTAGLAQ